MDGCIDRHGCIIIPTHQADLDAERVNYVIATIARIFSGPDTGKAQDRPSPLETGST